MLSIKICYNLQRKLYIYVILYIIIYYLFQSNFQSVKFSYYWIHSHFVLTVPHKDYHCHSNYRYIKHPVPCVNNPVLLALFFCLNLILIITFYSPKEIPCLSYSYIPRLSLRTIVRREFLQGTCLLMFPLLVPSAVAGRATILFFVLKQYQ